MSEKRSRVVVPFHTGTKVAPARNLEVSTLDLLAEVEAEIGRLRAKCRRLTAALEEAKAKIAALEKRPDASKAKPARATKPPRETKPASKAKRVDPPLDLAKTEPENPSAAPKRRALGRGLAQFRASRAPNES